MGRAGVPIPGLAPSRKASEYRLQAGGGLSPLIQEQAPLLSQGMGPSGASSSQSKTRRLCLKRAHLVPRLAVQITSFVTLAKPLLLSEPPLPPLRGANNSSLSGCCNDSERDGCEQSGRTEVCHRARHCKYPSNHCWPTNRHREDVPGSSWGIPDVPGNPETQPNLTDCAK